ncbi:MAG: adenylate/guanylate cyclase domain-containing protein [Candidatus Paracaedibacter sp.]
MNYDVLEYQYSTKQGNRIDELVTNIKDRKHSLTLGRTIPSEGSLALGTGKRIKIAVMFLDISQFSSLMMEEEIDQRNILDSLNLFFTEMIRIAEDYSGIVEKNTGDGLMVYFADEGPLGLLTVSGAKKAVACALTMFSTHKSFISSMLSKLGTPSFDFRICIDYGWVTIANIGAARRFGAFVAIGLTANRASKMLTLAKPNEILIGENVRSLLPQPWLIHCRLKARQVCETPYKVHIFIKRWENK